MKLLDAVKKALHVYALVGMVESSALFPPEDDVTEGDGGGTASQAVKAQRSQHTSERVT